MKWKTHKKNHTHMSVYESVCRMKVVACVFECGFIHKSLYLA